MVIGRGSYDSVSRAHQGRKAGRVRRLLLGLLLPFVLTFGIAVSSAGPAEAFLVAPVMAPAIIPSAVAAASALGPVGWAALGVAAVGAGAWYAYSNKDEISQWFSDEGTGTDANTVGGDAATQTDSYGNKFAFRMSATNPEVIQLWLVWGGQPNGNLNGYTKSIEITFGCDVGGSVSGQFVSLTPGNGGGLGPNSVVTEALSTQCVAAGGKSVGAVATRLGVVIASFVREGADRTKSETYGKATCLKADGTTTVLTGPTTQMSGREINTVIPSCEAASAGAITVKTETYRRHNAAWDTWRPGTSWIADQAALNPNTGTYKLCGPGHACTLGVTLDGVLCTVGGECAEWYQNSASSRYACLWGPYTLPTASGCKALRYNYTPDTTRDENGVAYAAPGTNPDGTPQPTPAPTPAPGVDPLPTTGTNTPPAPEEGGPAPDPTDTSGENCMGAAWSWNPVNWVYIPSKCALSWAFIPADGTLETAFDGISAKWEATQVPAWSSGISGVVGGVGGIGASASTGCAGPQWSFSMAGKQYPLHFLDACDEPYAGYASTTRLVLTVMFIVGGAVACFRLLLAGFGAQEIAPPKQLELF